MMRRRAHALIRSTLVAGAQPNVNNWPLGLVETAWQAGNQPTLSAHMAGTGNQGFNITIAGADAFGVFGTVAAPFVAIADYNNITFAGLAALAGGVAGFASLSVVGMTAQQMVLATPNIVAAAGNQLRVDLEYWQDVPPQQSYQEAVTWPGIMPLFADMPAQLLGDPNSDTWNDGGDPATGTNAAYSSSVWAKAGNVNAAILEDNGYSVAPVQPWGGTTRGMAISMIDGGRGRAGPPGTDDDVPVDLGSVNDFVIIALQALIPVQAALGAAVFADSVPAWPGAGPGLAPVLLNSFVTLPNGTFLFAAGNSPATRAFATDYLSGSELWTSDRRYMEGAVARVPPNAVGVRLVSWRSGGEWGADGPCTWRLVPGILPLVDP